MFKARQEKVREKSQLCHPRDRRVRQMEKKDKRTARLAMQKDRLTLDKALRNMRLFWFRQQCIALGYLMDPVPRDRILPLVQLYINRNEGEIEVLRKCRNPPNGRIKQLQQVMEVEMDAFRSAKGIEIPVLTTGDDVEILTSIWDGEPETAVVVPVTGVSIGAGKVDAEGIHSLQQLLRPMVEVRSVATKIMPKRSLRFSETGAKKVSVKSLASSSADAVTQRSRTNAVEKQHARLKKNRRKVMERARLGDDDDEVL